MKKNKFLYDLLTSGHLFTFEEKELELNYVFFNAILFINLVVVFIASVIRFSIGQYFFAVGDLTFTLISLGILVLARLSKRYYSSLQYAVFLLSLSLISINYYFNPHSIIGTSWFLVILMASFYFLTKQGRIITYAIILLIILWIRYNAGCTLSEILLGILPLTSAYFFLWFSDSKHNILRTHIEDEKDFFAYHATHDSLTGVYNRYYFFKELNNAILTAKAYEERFALVFIDINDFKMINDQYGHMAGDYILNSLAKRIKEHLDSRSILARFGGDEFVIISFENTHPEEMHTPLEQLEQSISHTFVYDKKSINLTLSIGIAYYPDDGITAKELLHKSDQTMYGTKNNRK